VTRALDYMQVAPPMPAMMRLAQKLSEPPDWAKLQHLLAPVSVQSEGCVQSRTTSVPEQVAPESCVMHCAAPVHATARGPLVQLGMVPPVMGMFPQQTLPEPGQSEGFEQTCKRGPEFVGARFVRSHRDPPSRLGAAPLRRAGWL